MFFQIHAPLLKRFVFDAEKSIFTNNHKLMPKAIIKPRKPINGIPSTFGFILVVHIILLPINKAAIKTQTTMRLIIRSKFAIGASLPNKFRFTLICPFGPLSRPRRALWEDRATCWPRQYFEVVFLSCLAQSISRRSFRYIETISMIFVIGSSAFIVPSKVTSDRASIEIPFGSMIEYR